MLKMLDECLVALLEVHFLCDFLFYFSLPKSLLNVASYLSD
jgi:hypothetical protein